LIRGINVPGRCRANVFTAPDLVGINPIRAVPGFKISEQPVFATAKKSQLSAASPYM